MVDEVLDAGNKVGGIRLKDVKTGATRDLPVEGLFVAIGHQPNTDLFKGQLEMEDSGYLVTGRGATTNVDGVFACGDAIDPTYRQAVTAAGTGRSSVPTRVRRGWFGVQSLSYFEPVDRASGSAAGPARRRGCRR